jgi:uncharacterized protein (DUF2267 family)
MSTLTKDKIEQLAPDQASLGAALKLMKPAIWPTLARDEADGLLWGECQGSGATPYRVVVSADDVGYKCTCPSRKFPCKHVLAVMLMRCDRPERFPANAVPDWVQDWLSRRRPKTAGKPAAPASTAASTPGASLAAALQEVATESAIAPTAIVRAQAQRRRLREEREAAVLAGLDDLDRWIVDQINLGLAGFAQRAAHSTKTLATRLVDAKAQGLATRLEMLAADIFRTPEQQRGDLALERLAALALISAAYRVQDRLPPPLKADVRRVTSWTMRREELLADAQAPHIIANWIVAATRSEVQVDRLRRLETWLARAAPANEAPSIALLIDFVPASGGPASSPFAAGEVFSGEVVFYPSATPLRGLLATRVPAAAPVDWPKWADGLDAALATYGTVLAAQPWLESWPLGAGGLSVARLAAGRLALADDSGRALPIDRAQTEALTVMLGLSPISALFIWDGACATLLAADTPIGRWYHD